MKSVTHQTTLHLSFKIKCCVDRLRPPSIFGQAPRHSQAVVNPLEGVRLRNLGSIGPAAPLHLHGAGICKPSHMRTFAVTPPQANPEAWLTAPEPCGCRAMGEAEAGLTDHRG